MGRSFSQPDRARPYKVPFGSAGMWIFAGLGLFGSVVAFLLSFFPPSQIAVGSPTIYIAILVLGDVICIAIPIAIYALRRASWKTPEGLADFEPFSKDNVASRSSVATAVVAPVLS